MVNATLAPPRTARPETVHPREATFRAGHAEATFHAEAARLNRRMGAVAVVICAQLLALTVAIEVWASGHGSLLPALLGLQVAGFLMALAIWRLNP